MVKKEVFEWLEAGTKSIDIRKGTPRNGASALFQSGANYLEFSIVKKEMGALTEVITEENFKSVIPVAQNLNDAINYLKAIYRTQEGVFTAYHLTCMKKR